ncbi:MAG TPA: hypothetical protein DGN60_05415 [Chloroflexi bacterium]|nr:hypothetical protein [Chloroflexota bacterium]
MGSMNITRWVGYLLLNVFVSAAVAVAVLMYWERYQKPYANIGLTPVESANVEYSVIREDQIDHEISNETSQDSTTYRVRAGDTIGRIALQFDLTVEELMQENNIVDPNRLAIDQILIVPVTKSLEPTERPMATESAIETVAVFDSDSLPVSESTHSLEIRSVNSVGNLETESLVVVNWGTTVSLLGWSIVSSAGDTYVFPELSLHESGQVTVNTSIGNNTVTDLYWGKSEAQWESGIKISLVDPSGNIHANYEIQ